MQQKLRIKLLKYTYKLNSYRVIKSLRLNRVARVKRHPRRALTALIALFFLSFYALSILLQPAVQAQTLQLDSSQILDGTRSFNQVQIGSDNKSISLQRGNIGSWTGDNQLSMMPLTPYSINYLVYGPNDSLYMLTGRNGCVFSRYSIELRTWQELKAAPVGCNSDSVLAYDHQSAFYYMPGGLSDQLFKYDIASDSWTQLESAPVTIGGGASGTYVNTGSNQGLYVMRGNSSASFWRYEPPTNTWVQRASFPASTSVDAGINITWDKAGTIYAISNYRGEFKQYSVLTNSWTNLSSPTGNDGARTHSLVPVDGLIYMMSLHRSAEQQHLYSFNPASGTWTNRAQIPIGQVRDFLQLVATDGSDSIYAFSSYYENYRMQRYDVSDNKWVGFEMASRLNMQFNWQPVYDGAQSLYWAGGQFSGNTNQMWKKDLNTGTITQIGAQFNTSYGSTGAYLNNALYMLNAHSNPGFGKFDLASNSWVSLANAPFSSGRGSDVIDGGNGYLYVTFNGRSNFYRFSEAGGWEARSSMSRTIGNGSQLARIGDFIYVLAGDGSASVSRYTISTNTWTTIKDLPVSNVTNGAFMTSDNSRYLYVGTSDWTPDKGAKYYRFDTTTSTWQRMADMPQVTQPGAHAFYRPDVNKVYVSQGEYDYNLWEWTASSSAYVRSGNWYSKALNLTQVQAWDSLNITSSGSGTVTAFTRTSSAGNLWSDWQQVSGSSINSPRNKYLQIKVTLAGDGNATPTVTDMTLNYSQETAAPNLPSQFRVKDKKDGTELSSGVTYEHQHPYISWGGASDGANGSGVAGYYVYFGTNSDADPVTDGNYQTSTDYTVTSPMEAGSIYYVRIKVKDVLGNISDAATYFSYRYFYISPPGSVLKSSQSDFAEGTNTGLSISSDGTASLVKQNQGTWATGTQKMLPFRSYGGAMSVMGDHLYVMRGITTNEFWRYNTETMTWERRANIPANAHYGSSLTSDGERYLYAITGSGTGNFFQYDTLNDTWNQLPTLPAFAQNGSVITHMKNGKIFVLLAGAAEVYEYSIADRQYTTLAAPPLTISSNAGSGIWFDGDNTIYITFGHWDTTTWNRKSFTAYTISTNSWRNLASPPQEFYGLRNALTGDGRGNLYMFGNDGSNGRDKTNMAFKYSVTANAWETIPNSSANVRDGTTASDNKRYIYIIPAQGNGQKLVRYDTIQNVFSPNDDLVGMVPQTGWNVDSYYSWQAGQISSMTYDGRDKVYMIGGANEGNTSRVVSFSLSTKKSTYLAAPAYVGIGGALEYTNGNLYYMSAQNRRDLYKYDFSNGEWIRLADAPGNIYRAGSRALMGTNDGSLVAVAGNGRKLYKFTPNSGDGAWTTLTDAPNTILNGAARYDGNDFIYVLAGNGSSTFYRYSMSGNSWVTLANTPGGMNFGATLQLDDGILYATRGGNFYDTYQYSIANNSWQEGPASPEFFRWGADSVKVSDDQALYLAGQDNYELWRFNFPSNDKAYSGYAVHESVPLEIDGLFDYAGIRASVNTPKDTKIEFWTRTSGDNSTWSEWQMSDSIKNYSGSMSVRLASTPQRFTQVQIKLYSYDNMSTPSVSDYALDYYFDVTPPTNPTVLSAFTDSTRDTVAEDNVWYNNNKPLFDWPDPGEAGGATDGPLGSNLRGYYVYVGTDPTAVPRTAGVFVEGTEYSPTLTTSATYYVRIQAMDMTGNVDAAIFAPFRYKFDNTPPSTPSLITVTPSGFTGNNNYTFQWPNSFDTDSGIAEYCYHTGALSGPFAVETCQSGTEVANVSAAYQPGTNVFYVRTKDIAGNYSVSYAQASYYFSTDPPTPVTNFRAVPPTSEQNLFAFIWDLPALFSGDPDQLQYCYSVNVLPSPTNTSCTTDRFISAFKAATQQGTNSIYMVAKDEAGNANWNNYAIANFIANTVSPGIPLNLVVTDTSDSQTERWSLTLTWNRPLFEGNGISQYVIERSADNHTYTTVGRVTNTAYVDLTVEPDKDYYYRIRAADNVDNQGGASAIVMQRAKGSFANPPAVVSAPIARPSFDTTTVSWVTDRPSTTFVYYGTSPTNLAQSKGTLDLSTEHSITLTGLSPTTSYYYRIQSFDNNRSYELAKATSQLYTFRTAEAGRIFGVTSSDITLDSGLISWQTSIPTRAKIEYGPTLRYGFTHDNGGGFSTNNIMKLEDLPSGSTIHYRIVATADYGGTITSDDYTIRTLARPAISNLRFQPLNDSNNITVKVTWNTNVPTTSEATYRALGTRKEAAETTLKTSHELLIPDLASNTEYDFEIRGRDQYGYQANAGSQKWRSGVDTKEPKISDLTVSAVTNSSVGSKKAQMVLTWKTDEPTTTQVQYGKASTNKLDNRSPLSTEPTTNHVVVLSNLELAEVYRVQPISRDISGNTGYGPKLATVTPDISQSPLDVILTSLQRLFRF